MNIEIADADEYIKEDRKIALEESYSLCDSITQHEALDRTFIVGELLDSFVLSNAFIFNDESLYKQAHNISWMLNDLYANIADKIYDSDD